MAKEKVIHKCGHEATVQLYGPMKERDRKKAWLASQVCPECKRAALERSNAEAAEKNASAGLPELTGTPKQVAWAETIRANILEKLRIVGNPPEEYRRWLEGRIEEIRSTASAAWWIDNRNSLLDRIADECRQKIRELKK